MKSRICIVLTLALAASTPPHGSTVFAGSPPQSAAFTYQGVLKQSNALVNGNVDVQFKLFDAATGGVQIGSTVLLAPLTVNDGLLRAVLDFGSLAFNGEERWLEIAITNPSTNGSGPFVTLSPRQKIESTPYAAYALSAALAGAYDDAVNFTNAANTFAGTFAGNGAGLTSLNAAALSGLIPSANIAGTYANALTLSNVSNTFTGTFSGTHSGNGAALFGLNATNIATGTIANARTTGTSTNTPNTLVLRDASGNFSASTITGTHAGNGTALTSLNATNITNGTLSESRLPSSLLNRIPTFAGIPVLTGSLSLPGTGNSVFAANGFLYCNTLQPAEFHVFDLADPSAPAHRATVPAVSANDLVVAGNFAYLVGNGIFGMQIFNISDPDNPTVAGTFATSSSPIGIAVSGSLAYVVSLDLDVLEIFNISNPASVTPVGSLPIPGNPVSIRVSGAVAYVGLDQGNAVQIVNISNPASPSLLGSVPTGAGPRVIAHAGSHVYVVCNDADLLQIVNVSNPNSPAVVGSIATQASPTDVQVSGPLAFVVNNQGDSVQVFDVSTPASPVLLQTIATNAEPRRVGIANGFGYVTTSVTKSLQTIAPDGVSFGVDSPITGSGMGLSSLNASSIAAGVLANAFTSGTSDDLADTLVLRDATGSFEAASARFAMGNASAPSFSFTGDDNTGMYRSASDTLAFATGGLERLRIASSGRVGIGTISPSADLHVLGNTAGSVIQTIENTGGGEARLRLASTAGQFIEFRDVVDSTDATIGVPFGSEDLVFSVPSITRMLIQSSTGNVGVGTTAPAQRLHVSNGSSAGTTHANAELVVEDNSSCYINLMSPAASERGISLGSPTDAVHGGIYYTDAGGMSLRTGGNTTRVIVDGTGNVGIGTAGNSIDAVLHVQSAAARVMKVDRYSSDGELLAWARDDGAVGSVTVTAGVVAYGAFTGVHYAKLDQPLEPGTLVSLTGDNAILGQRTQGESVYGVTRTTRANDPAVLGVYLGDLDGENYNHPHDLAQIAAVGNGDLWVIDAGSPIEPGDDLIASSVPGCAMKDDPARFGVGYVIARAAERVDWSSVQPDSAGVRRARISVLFSSFTRGSAPAASDRPLDSQNDRRLAEMQERLDRQAEEMAELRRTIERLAGLLPQQ